MPVNNANLVRRNSDTVFSLQRVYNLNASMPWGQKIICSDFFWDSFNLHAKFNLSPLTFGSDILYSGFLLQVSLKKFLNVLIYNAFTYIFSNSLLKALIETKKLNF